MSPVKKKTARKAISKSESLVARSKRLETENAEKDTAMAEMEEKLAAERARNDHLQAVLEGKDTAPLVSELPGAGTDEPLEPDVLRDPFESQNPHKIIAHPPGYRLGWCNPHYRETRGWRGWRIVEYDSDIGRNLKLYLHDPPRRMEHATDNIVRRGDSILCFIEEEWYLARQQKRVTRANRWTQEHAEDLRPDSAKTRRRVSGDGKVGGQSMLS